MVMGRIIIDLPKGQEKEIEKMLELGLYKTKSELVRDAVRKLIIEEKKRRMTFSRNGGDEYF
jgi:Arc/MetJ-type ribon-helix-helix transcriptional regulator